LAPSKAARGQAALLEEPAGPARAKIIAAQLFFEKFVAMHNSHASFDVGFRWIASTPLAHAFKRTPVRGDH
jgi:hypothetical protein